MDDERQQGSWWGNLETIHPDEDHEDYIEEQNDGEKRKSSLLSWLSSASFWCCSSAA